MLHCGKVGMRLRLEDGIRWESHEQIEELNLRPEEFSVGAGQKIKSFRAEFLTLNRTAK